MTTVFYVEIECDNDAFDGDPAAEVARLLEQTAQRIRREWPRGVTGHGLSDFNGNYVGIYGLRSER